MSYELYLSYSGKSTYRVCAKRYYLCYVEKKPIVRNPRDVMFGSVIGKIFEWFYARSVWRQPDPSSVLLSYVDDAMAEVFAKERFSPGSDPSYVVTLRNDLKTYVPSGVEVIRRNRLLTPGSQAELDLTQEYTRNGVTLRLGGKADFVHPSEQETVLIDGKGGKHRNTYVDPEQVIWYGSLYYLKFHVAPHRIGFLYWRFPADPLQWVDYGEDDIRKSIDEAFEVASKVRLKQFAASPSSACRRCDYRAHCAEGQEYSSQRDVEAKPLMDTSVFEPERVV